MEKVIFQTYPHWYERMNDFIKENEAHPICDVCFLGDSIIEASQVTRVSKTYINRGIISDKTQGVLMSLDDRVFALSPKTVVLFIGTNDICDGYLISTIENNLTLIVNKLLERNIRVIVSTITPPCYYEADNVNKIYFECRDINRINEYNNFIRNMKNVVVFDAFKVLADENESLRSCDTLDGLHLTDGAYKKLYEELKKIL